MYATVVSAHWSLCPNQIAEFSHVIMTSSHACSRVRDVIDTIDNIYLLPDKVYDDTVNFKLVVSLEECNIELCNNYRRCSLAPWPFESFLLCLKTNLELLLQSLIFHTFYSFC